ncbi:hypothetical protein BUALT_Bualt13G0085800 [Buddleja alternifolia]|uniref:Uncharacterized protein n=1 Tax=Buddleja alternifolia TaxID=168488 RepID=A0AAV6WRB0_9LAMI|nr:hypothetical protein BUALT_Bualt13G0085800 [Buddleja alternifolia]
MKRRSVKSSVSLSRQPAAASNGGDSKRKAKLIDAISLSSSPPFILTILPLICNDQNNEMEQLGQKLMLTTFELDKLKAEMKDEMKKNNEYVKELIHLLKYAIHQRDEAKTQLQNLLNNNTAQIPNSSITESNSLSEPYNNYRSHDLVVNQPFVENSNASSLLKIDQGSLIIDSLAMKRVLPQKGKFLQAVLEAGPLLQTLLLAGPLPRWRNPPQLQPFQIPPVSINGCDSREQKPVLNVGRVIASSLNSQPYAQMSCGSAQVPMSNYTNGSIISSGIVNDNGCFRLVKRQRFC